MSHDNIPKKTYIAEVLEITDTEPKDDSTQVKVVECLEGGSWHQANYYPEEVFPPGLKIGDRFQIEYYPSEGYFSCFIKPTSKELPPKFDPFKNFDKSAFTGKKKE